MKFEIELSINPDCDTAVDVFISPPDDCEEPPFVAFMVTIGIPACETLHRRFSGWEARLYGDQVAARVGSLCNRLGVLPTNKFGFALNGLLAGVSARFIETFSSSSLNKEH